MLEILNITISQYEVGDSFKYHALVSDDKVDIPYSAENEPPPLFDLQVLAQVFYLFYKLPLLRCKNCIVSKNERMAIDKTAVFRSLNGLLSSLVSSFAEYHG